MGYKAPTPAAMSTRNREFWEEKSEALLRHFKHELIAEQTMNDVRREVDRQLPIGFQQSVEELAALNEARLKDTFRYVARNGGRAKKTDALQMLIVEMVRKNPKISTDAVLDALRELQGGGLICQVTETHICVELPGGRLKDTPISSLKDRVSCSRQAIK